METVLLTNDEFLRLRTIQVKQRTDCHAAFTAVPNGEIWPFASFGRTPDEYKVDARGFSEALDEIANSLLFYRPEGGRLFIDRDRAFYKLSDSDVGVSFVTLFVVREYVSYEPPTRKRSHS